MTTVVDSIAHGLPDVKSIVHSLVTSDPVYSTAPFLPAASIPVELHDIGMPGVSISPLRLFLTELEVATYEVVLFSQPLDTVVISIIDPEAQNFVTLDKDTLTFETGDWDTPQVVTATALDTFVANGVEPLKFTFVHTSSSTDTAYNGAGTYFVPSNGVLNVTLYNKDIECVNPCLPGKYPMLYGDIPICLNCPMGFYCPGECNGPIACPIGTRSDAEKAISKSTCESCPEGYISAYEASTTCTICPSGTICPDPASPWTPCATGSFSSAGSIECTNCTAGYACADPSLAPEICQDGQYSTAGQTECTPCPAGHFCPTTSAEPVQCYAGYYSPGLITDCTECPAGSSCMDPAVPPRACSEGTYSTATSEYCQLCPSGYSCASAGGVPVPCDTATYRIEGDSICHQCPPGYTKISVSEQTPTSATTSIDNPGAGSRVSDLSYDLLESTTSPEAMCDGVSAFLSSSRISVDETFTFDGLALGVMVCSRK